MKSTGWKFMPRHLPVHSRGSQHGCVSRKNCFLFCTQIKQLVLYITDYRIDRLHRLYEWYWFKCIITEITASLCFPSNGWECLVLYKLRKMCTGKNDWQKSRQNYQLPASFPDTKNTANLPYLWKNHARFWRHPSQHQGNLGCYS